MRRLRYAFTAQVLLAVLTFPLFLLGQALTRVATIDLPGPKGQRFDYLTTDDKDHRGTYSIAGCQYNHGTAVDSKYHRAFLLCGGNRTITVFALDSHRAHLPLARGADVVKFDSGLGRVYAACSSGVIGVYQEDDADHFRKVEDFPVQKLVHSLTIDTATHRVYAPEQEENGTPVVRMIV